MTLSGDKVLVDDDVDSLHVERNRINDSQWGLTLWVLQLFALELMAYNSDLRLCTENRQKA